VTDRKRQKAGILGGTFDPIHNGHLFIAQTALEEVELDRVVFVPSGRPPHKTHQRITESAHRLKMLQKAIQSNPYFECSTCEIDNEKIGYTYDLLEKMKQNNPDVDFYFIMGADSFMDIKSWYRYNALLTLAGFIVMKRKGYDAQLLDHQAHHFSQKQQEKIIILDSPKLEISSSDIRNRVNLGKSIKYLVPEEVERYIESNRLYRNGQECL